MHSQIQLISRKFTDITLHAQDLDGDGSGIDLSHMIAVDQDDHEPTHWRAKVGVRIENKGEGELSPYVGEIIVAGHFKLSETFPAEKAESMVYLNAGAMLYGAIRELVISLTSQSIHGELMLPAVDARSFLPAPKEEGEPKNTV